MQLSWMGFNDFMLTINKIINLMEPASVVSDIAAEPSESANHISESEYLQVKDNRLLKDVACISHSFFGDFLEKQEDLN